MLGHFKLLILSLSVLAKPLQSTTEVHNNVTELRSEAVLDFLPFTRFAQAAYCPSQKISSWTCGPPCNALQAFEPKLVGGDGGSIQYFFVGYWRKQKAIVVSHQGTDLTRLDAILTDVKALRTRLDPKLFPGVPSNVTVHVGFAATHAETAEKILTEVQKILGITKAQKVYLTGHSLGGALSTLEALYLRLHLPENIHIKAVTYGMPRVGDPEFVKFFESKVPDYTRIVYDDDAIPAMPPRALGYDHIKGEVRILEDGHVFSCPGNDYAEDSRCHAGSVSNGLMGNPGDHLGPYPGNIRMGSFFCESRNESKSMFSRLRNSMFDLSASLPPGVALPPFFMGFTISAMLGVLRN